MGMPFGDWCLLCPALTDDYIIEVLILSSINAVNLTYIARLLPTRKHIPKFTKISGLTIINSTACGLTAPIN
jgi:hypothetical protein